MRPIFTCLGVAAIIMLSGCAGPTAFEEVGNYRLTFLMSGTFQLENGIFRDYLEDGRTGRLIEIDPEFCLRAEYNGETYYVAVTSVNGGGSMYEYGVMVFKNGETVQSLALGDRIRVKSLTCADGRIRVAYYVHRDDEKLSEIPTLPTEAELLLSEACRDGTEYKRLNLKNPETLRIMGQPEILIDHEELLPPLPAGSSEKYGRGGFSAEQDAAVECFIPVLKRLLAADDSEAIIALIDFPVRLEPGLTAGYTIRGPEDFRRYFSTIFHPEYRKKLLLLSDDDFVSEESGIRIGDYQLWLRPGPGTEVRIKQINY